MELSEAQALIDDLIQAWADYDRRESKASQGRLDRQTANVLKALTGRKPTASEVDGTIR